MALPRWMEMYRCGFSKVPDTLSIVFGDVGPRMFVAPPHRIPESGEIEHLRSLSSLGASRPEDAGPWLFAATRNAERPTPCIILFVFEVALNLAPGIYGEKYMRQLFEGHYGKPAPFESLYRLRTAPSYQQLDGGSSWRPSWLRHLLVTRTNSRGSTVYEPRLNHTISSFFFWGSEALAPAEAAGVLWRRMLGKDEWLEPSFRLFATLRRVEQLHGYRQFQVRLTLGVRGESRCRGRAID